MTSASQVVKEAKEFLKAKEIRDSMHVVFIPPGHEALKSVVNYSIPREFDEAYVDLSDPKNCYSKSSKVNNIKPLALIALNFILLVGVSAYNFWQFQIMAGLDKANT